MKSLKKKKVIIIMCIIILVCTFFLYQICSPVYIYLFTKLNQSVLDINDNNNFKSFSMLDSSIKNAKVFLTGENHSVSANKSLELKFLKYLNQNADVKYYLIEMGPSQALLINKYLNTGDETILRSVFNALKESSGYTKESYKIFKDIYEYNKNLGANNKIVVVGIDIEQIPESAMKYIYSLMPSKPVPVSIKTPINMLKEYEKYMASYSDAMEFCRQYEETMAKNYEDYREYFGENFFDFKLIGDNLDIAIKYIYNKSPNGSSGIINEEMREKQIYLNFKEIYSHLPKGKYYGQFGAYHVLQGNYEYNSSSFAMMLNNEDSPVKGKIISIPYFYNNCSYLQYSNEEDKYKEKKLPKNYSEEKLFNNVFQSKATLVKTKGLFSPFQKRLYLIKDPVNGGVTSDYFQYFVMIKDSPAQTPLQ